MKIELTENYTKNNTPINANDVQTHGNNQLHRAMRFSDNSIPETASSRQSDVIKSRGYLIHGIHCIHCTRMHVPRMIVCVRTRMHACDIDTCMSEFMDSRWWFGLEIWDVLCRSFLVTSVSGNGKRASFNHKLDSAWVKCQALLSDYSIEVSNREKSDENVTRSPAFATLQQKKKKK